jgi:hypothetical protein
MKNIEAALDGHEDDAERAARAGLELVGVVGTPTRLSGHVSASQQALWSFLGNLRYFLQHLAIWSIVSRRLSIAKPTN